jgi:hypothetical protein
VSFDQIRTGTVIRYPYLWAREAHDGEREGRKDRPVAVGVRVVRMDGDLILLFPITSKEPETARFSVELPTIEKRRAGLDPMPRLWLILDEFNTDIIGRSFYLEPIPPIGRLSKAFFLPLLREFVARRRSFTQVDRLR